MKTDSGVEVMALCCMPLIVSHKNMTLVRNVCFLTGQATYR